MSFFDAVFVRPWPFWAGGLAIGLFAVGLAWVTGKSLGVSSGFGTLCSLVSGLPLFRTRPFAERWRLHFLLGIPLGGFLAARLGGTAEPRTGIALLTGPHVPAALALAVGGFLVGYGARLAGG
jgi:hypothetical protein